MTSGCICVDFLYFVKYSDLGKIDYLVILRTFSVIIFSVISISGTTGRYAPFLDESAQSMKEM